MLSATLWRAETQMSRAIALAARLALVIAVLAGATGVHARSLSRLLTVRSAAAATTTTTSRSSDGARVHVPIRVHQLPHPFRLPDTPPAAAHGAAYETGSLLNEEQSARLIDKPTYFKRERKFRSPFPQHSGGGSPRVPTTHGGKPAGHQSATPHTSGGGGGGRSDAPASSSSANGTTGGGGGGGGAAGSSTGTHHGGGGAGGGIAAEIDLNDYYSIVYTGPIGIGTPAATSGSGGDSQQSFDVVFDTGSADLWVFSADIPRGNQYSWLHYYNHALSTTYQTNGKGWEIQYGVGKCSGYMSQDSVTLGGSLTVTDQTFAEVTSFSNNFGNKDQPLDGICGLAFRGATYGGTTSTIIDNLYAQGFISSRMFSFYLTSADSGVTSELVLGEPDPRYYHDQMLWSDVLHAGRRDDASMWYLSLDAIALDSAASTRGNLSDPIDRTPIPGTCGSTRPDGTPSQPCVCLPDSGTSFLTVPLTIFTTIKLAIMTARPDCAPVRDNPGILQCTKYSTLGASGLPELSYRISGTWLTITGDDYVLAGNGQVAIQSFNSNVDNADLFILGDVFLRAYYTVFDMDNQRVGFAHAPDDTNTRLPFWIIALITICVVLVGASIGFLVVHLKHQSQARGRPEGIALGGSTTSSTTGSGYRLGGTAAVLPPDGSGIRAQPGGARIDAAGNVVATTGVLPSGSVASAPHAPPPRRAGALGALIAGNTPSSASDATAEPSETRPSAAAILSGTARRDGYSTVPNAPNDV